MKCKMNDCNFEILDNAVHNLREGWTEHGLSLERIYDVFAIGIYKNVVKILIDPEGNARPVWYSIEDFIICDKKIPIDWEITTGPQDDWSLIIGYDKLVNSEEHFNDLLERDSKAISYFIDMKQRL